MLYMTSVKVLRLSYLNYYFIVVFLVIALNVGMYVFHNPCAHIGDIENYPYQTFCGFETLLILFFSVVCIIAPYSGFVGTRLFMEYLNYKTNTTLISILAGVGAIYLSYYYFWTIIKLLGYIENFFS